MTLLRMWALTAYVPLGIVASGLLGTLAGDVADVAAFVALAGRRTKTRTGKVGASVRSGVLWASIDYWTNYAANETGNKNCGWAARRLCKHRRGLRYARQRSGNWDVPQGDDLKRNASNPGRRVLQMRTRCPSLPHL
ncbi:hypothetical protein GGX14DRAFT_483259 [Mycena pura]|uniref:Uncharacterized protein n=1 Tax=Mycena pura TaxID=153505 RepID=A0AAD6ULW4_9AGAR|nr:hypothetical protein GGX14DRAFT_483259 [Mycena pura]